MLKPHCWLLICIATLMAAEGASAQTFTTLHQFNPATDGANPWGKLVLSGTCLYGTTSQGGTSSNGTVFAMNIDGSGFSILHNFSALSNLTNTDGIKPEAGLLLLSNTLYGTAMQGGNFYQGTVFSLNTDGSGFATLHSFSALFSNTNYDGTHPITELVESDGTLYGTALSGGNFNHGTVFALNLDGTGFTTLHQFSAFSPGVTNIDGASPHLGLVLSGNTLYGTAQTGGNFDYGTVYAMNTDGADFNTLYNFSALSTIFYGTNTDGAQPDAGLILAGNTLYGTTFIGGTANQGTVFAVNTDGTGFTNLHNFSAVPYSTNSDGARPATGLVLSSSILYGTTTQGGASGQGTIFLVNTDGTGFTTLHNFSATSNNTNSDGAQPEGGLILVDNLLYGVAMRGGSSGVGTLFSIALATNPRLAISMASTNVVLTWPTNAFGFALESSPMLSPQDAWTAVSPLPAIVNGRYTVTNPICNTPIFYRLHR
jgi:uncharacterized repeat protein (TIGR03803 family)